MQRIFRPLLLLTLILGACASRPSSTEAPPVAPATVPPTDVQDSPTQDFSDLPALPIPRFARTLETPHIDQPPDGINATPTFENCGPQWTYQDQQELSDRFQQAIQQLQPGAEANTAYMGADCINADGSRDVQYKETNFNVNLQVDDLSNESDLGGWIVRIIQVIVNIPQDQIVGSNLGHVGIIFHSNGEEKAIYFDMSLYRSLPPGLNDAEIYKALQAPPTEQPSDSQVTLTPPTYGGCGYQWAYQDLPELSNTFQQSIQELQPEAKANAYAFGEDCIHADGSKTFLAKETDFNITLQVDDLSNESDLGEWIVKIMEVIENIPPDQIVGPGPGLVRIIFQSSSGQKAVNFYTNQYQALPAGLSNAEIYRALQMPQ